MGDAIPNYEQTWWGLATHSLPTGPRRCRTPDGWVHDGQSWPDVWAVLPFSLLVPISPQSCGGIPETARLGSILPEQ